MQAGKLDRLVKLKRRMIVKSGIGEDVASWPTAYANVWANKADARGSKRFMAQEFVAEQVTEFTLRYRDDVLATDRLECETQIYEITQIAEIGRHEGLSLLCRAVIA